MNSFPAPVGSTFLFKVEVYNIAGSTTSTSVGFVLGDVPDTPTAAPTSDLAVSSYNKLKIDYLTVAGNGGSPILTYSLEIDNGFGGDFVP